MSEKLNRKELKEPDQFIKLGQKILELVVQQKKKIFIILASFVVLLISTSLYFDWIKKVENEASFELAAVQELLKKSEGKLTDDIETKIYDIIKNYRKTYSAFAAELELANIYFNEKKYDRATELFNNVNKKTSINLFKIISTTNLAYIKEIQEDFESSLVYFKEVLNYNIEVFDLQAYFGISRCYEKLGKTNEARSIYNKIVSKYPNSEHAKTAKQYLAYLEE